MPSLYRTILKPIFDFLVALILLSILFVPAFYFAIRIFLQDFSNPFYAPKRVGKFLTSHKYGLKNVTFKAAGAFFNSPKGVISISPRV